MEQMEEDKKYSTARLLPPIDASYQPSRTVTKIPATSSLAEILAVLEQDGGVILTDFVSLETLDKIDEELEPYTTIAKTDSYDNFIGKKTLVIPGLYVTRIPLSPSLSFESHLNLSRRDPW